jgi:pimeloyl-ACP methyl ester carboxylesterase
MTTTLVLVHGGFHGAWCWARVTELLGQRGVPLVAVDLPSSGDNAVPPGDLHTDAGAVVDAVEAVHGPVVLAGHSYGGAVITEAGRERNVEHLVYLTAFACDTGESPSATAVDENLPFADFNDALVFSEDATTISFSPESARETFYHDCDRADADAAAVQLRPINVLCVTTPATSPAWRVKPSTYIVCTEDKALHPAMQRHLAERCTQSVEWPTAHSPFLNRPDLVAALLADLAR